VAADRGPLPRRPTAIAEDFFAPTPKSALSPTSPDEEDAAAAYFAKSSFSGQPQD
jgi:hypothetical protein